MIRLNNYLFFKGDPIDLNKLTDLQQIEKVHQLLRNDDAKIEYLVENRAKKKKKKINMR